MRNSKRNKAGKAVASIMAASLIGTAVPSMQAYADITSNNSAYNSDWSDGHACGTVSTFNADLECTDSEYNCNVNVSIQEYADGSETWSISASGDIELKPGKYYNLHQIGGFKEHGTISVLPANWMSGENIKVDSSVDINDANVFSLALYFNADGKDTISVPNGREIVRLSTTNTSDAVYVEDYDYIDRLDANLDGKVDACDASTILSIYADNSTDKPVRNMGEYYKLQDIKPNTKDGLWYDYPVAWNTAYGTPTWLRGILEEYNTTTEVITADGAREVRVNIKRFTDGQITIEVYNDSDAIKLVNTKEADSDYDKEFKQVIFRYPISVPDGYTVGISGEDTIETGIVTTDRCPSDDLFIMGKPSDYSIIDKAGAIRHASFSRRPVIRTANNSDYLPTGKVATITIVPDKTFRVDKTQDLIDIFGVSGWTEFDADYSNPRTVSAADDNYVKPEDTDDGIKCSGIIQSYTRNYFPENDLISRLDANLDGKVDACDASTVLSIYAYNSTRGNVKTMGDYYSNVKRDEEQKKKVNTTAKQAIEDLIANKYSTSGLRKYDLSIDRAGAESRYCSYEITPKSVLIKDTVTSADKTATTISNYGYNYNADNGMFTKSEMSDDCEDTDKIIDMPCVDILDAFIADELYEDIEFSNISESGDSIRANVTLPLRKFAANTSYYRFDAVTDDDIDNTKINVTFYINKNTGLVNSISVPSTDIFNLSERTKVLYKYHDDEDFRAKVEADLQKEYGDSWESIIETKPSVLDAYMKKSNSTVTIRCNYGKD